MKTKLPVNLNLFEIKLPIHALVSILHRASGFMLFLLIPFMLWLLQQSLSSAADFAALRVTFTHPFFKLVAWGFLSALFYHLLAGIRHLCMDAHLLPESLWVSKMSSWVVLIFSLAIIGFLGWEIWL
ncbi:MAG: succinate dehydrogenase, cytochrome b556 subunit [Gammaproteobacteria bacterium]